MAEDAKERMIRYLCDAHAVEEGSIASLQGIADEAAEDGLRSVIADHIDATVVHGRQLSDRISALGGDRKMVKVMVNTIIGKGSELLNLFHDADDKLTQDLIKVYALEHFEVGMYTALKAFADSVNDYETAALAQSILNEEQLQAERLLRLIPSAAKHAIIRTNIFPAA